MATPDRDEDADVEAAVRVLESRQGNQSWRRKRSGTGFNHLTHQKRKAVEQSAKANVVPIDLTLSDSELGDAGQAPKKARLS